jgi:hypothetical protein
MDMAPVRVRGRQSRPPPRAEDVQPVAHELRDRIMIPGERDEDAMSDKRRPQQQQQQPETPKRGEAAWRAARDAIATRNAEATKRARARRQAEYEEQVARRLAAERLERAELAKRRP